MTPKEKAEELVLKFENLLNYDFVSDLQWHDPNDTNRNRRVKNDAKKCALISVNEILEAQPSRRYWDTYYDETPSALIYWQEVKQEIEKL